MSLLVALSVGAFTLLLGLGAAVLAEVLEPYVRKMKVWGRAMLGSRGYRAEDPQRALEECI